VIAGQLLNVLGALQDAGSDEPSRRTGSPARSPSPCHPGLTPPARTTGYAGDPAHRGCGPNSGVNALLLSLTGLPLARCPSEAPAETGAEMRGRMDAHLCRGSRARATLPQRHQRIRNSRLKPLTSARSASSREPACEATPCPSVVTVTTGHVVVACTYEVPSSYEFRNISKSRISSRQGTSLHLRPVSTQLLTASSTRAGLGAVTRASLPHPDLPGPEEEPTGCRLDAFDTRDRRLARPPITVVSAPSSAQSARSPLRTATAPSWRQTSEPVGSCRRRRSRRQQCLAETWQRRWQRPRSGASRQP
jgi:hypothetical protein